MGAGEGPWVLHGRERAEPLDGLLRAAGLRSLHRPMIALRSRAEPPPARAPSVILVTSPATPPRCPGLSALGAPIFAVGEGTARALAAAGAAPRWVGEAGGAEAVASLRALVEDGVLGDHPVVWAVGAKALSPPLAAALGALRSAHVERWSVYENVPPAELSAQLAEAPRWAGALFASGSAVERYVEAGGPARAPDAALVAIGRPTAEALRGAGLVCAGVAARPEPAAMVQAMLEALSAPLSSRGTSRG